MSSFWSASMAISVAAATLFSTTPAMGITYDWFGGSGDWSNSANWTPSGIPGAGDAAVIGGGTVHLNNDLSVTGLDLDNATLSGTGTLTITGQFNWSGASTMTGGGTTVIAYGGVGELSGNPEHSLTARTLRIEGLFKHTGPGRLSVNSGSTVEIAATGTYEIEADIYLIYFSGGAPTFTNSGTLLKSGGNGEAKLDNIIMAVTTTGKVNCDTGTLYFPSSVNGSGTFNATGGATIHFGSYTTLTDATFTGAGLQKFTGNTLNLSGTCTASNNEIAGATVEGTHTLAGNWKWTSGNLSGEGTTTIAPGATLAFAGNTEASILTRTLKIDGTFVHEGAGRLNLNSGCTLETGSTGLVNLTGDRWWHHFSGGQATVVNNGTIYKSGGSGTATLENLVFNNTGLLDLASGSTHLKGGNFNNDGEARIRTGTLDHGGHGTSTGEWNISAGATALFTGGSPTMAQGATITGEGLFKVAGATVNVTGMVDFPRLELASGSISGNGTVNLTSEFDWTGISSMGGGGSTVVAEGATATLSSTGEMTLNSRALEIAGTFNHSGAGRLSVNSGSSIDITTTGVYNLQGDVELIYFSGGSPTFTSSGRLLKSAGTGTAQLNNISVSVTGTGTVDCASGTLLFPSNVSGTGTFNAAQGATIQFGSHTTLSDADFTGPGLQKFTGGTLLLSGTCTAFNNEIGGASLNGTHTLAGNWNWSSGNLSGEGTTTIAQGATLTFTGNTEHSILTRTLKIDGTFIHEGTGRLNLNSGCTVETGTTGLVNLTGDRWWDYFSGGQATVTNGGTFLKSGGSGTAILENLVFNNNGLLDQASGSIFLKVGSFNNNGEAIIRTGTLEHGGHGSSTGEWNISAGTTALFSAGSPTLAQGATIVGPGLFKVAGATVNVTGVVDFPRLELSSGSISGSGTVNVTSEFAWTGTSIMSGGGTTVIPNGAIATLSSAAEMTLNSRTLEIAGTLNHSGAGRLTVNSGSNIDITSTGTYDLKTDAYMVYFSGGAPSFTNSGTLVKSGGNGESKLDNIPMTVTGTGKVECQSGTLLFPASVSGTGTFNAWEGSGIQYATHTNLTDATFTGLGLQKFTGGTLTLSGTCSAENNEIAGASLNGTHVLSGKWDWSSGTLSGAGVTTIPQGSTLTLLGTNHHLLTNRTLQVDGAFVHAGSGRLEVNSGAALHVGTTGLVDIQGDWNWIYFSGGTPSVSIDGVLRKSAGTGDLILDNIKPLNGTTGRIESLSGTIKLSGIDGGGTLFSDAGAQILIEGNSSLSNVAFEGEGIHRLTGGTITLNGDCTASGVEIAGASIAGTHTLHGIWHWNSGQLVGPGTTTIGSDGILRLISDGDHTVTNRTVRNSGLIEHVGPGRLVLRNQSLLEVTPQGVVDIQTPSEWVDGGGTPSSIINNGNIIKSTNAGSVSIQIKNFTGNGRNIVETGWFFMKGNWLFHPDQGIIYLFDAGPAGFLLYDFNIQSWGWSSEAMYPYIFWYGRFGIWSHYSTGDRPDGRWFYDLSHSGWMPETDMIP